MGLSFHGTYQSAWARRVLQRSEHNANHHQTLAAGVYHAGDLAECVHAVQQAKKL